MPHIALLRAIPNPIHPTPRDTYAALLFKFGQIGQTVSLIELHNRVGKKSLRFRYLFLSKFSINISRAPHPYSFPGEWWRWERPAMDGCHGVVCPVLIELVLIPFNQFLSISGAGWPSHIHGEIQSATR